MRIAALIAFAAAASGVCAQNREELWLGAGIKREVVKDLDAGFSTNMRINSDGNVQVLFQELSLKSSHISWCRPSVDYRLINSYAQNGNTTLSNRLNFNLDFRTKVKEVKLGTRFRYQIYLGDFVATGTDLDPSFRIKPYAEWKIPKTRLIPEASVEFFYNPQNGPLGDRFNRVRYGLGTGIDLPHSQELGIKYYFGQRFNTNRPYYEHLLTLDYTYEWKTKAEKDKKAAKRVRPLEKTRTIRTL
jgi:hypothetical protein